MNLAVRESADRFDIHACRRIVTMLRFVKIKCACLSESAQDDYVVRSGTACISE